MGWYLNMANINLKVTYEINEELSDIKTLLETKDEMVTQSILDKIRIITQQAFEDGIKFIKDNK